MDAFPALSPVALSRGSTPASTVNRMAASRTLRVMGPAVSWLCAIGMMPERLTRPSVGLMPTIPFAEDGHTTDPSVSVPIAAAHRLPATAAPDPELEPHGLRSSAYGFFVCPPRPLQPLLEWLERIFAHSLRLVLPKIIAPACRSFRATKESLAGRDPNNASDPAVVCIWSAVSMLSLIRIGMPCNGPRILLSFRSRSRLPAIA